MKRILLALVCLYSLGSWASEPINVECGQSSTEYLGTHFHYATYPVDAKLEEVMGGNFIKGETEVLNLGTGDSAYWMHTSFYFLESCKKYLQFGSHGIITLDAYILENGKLREKYELGSEAGYDKWAVPNQNYTLPITGQSGDTVSVYMKLRSNQQLLVPVKLYSPPEYWSINLRDNLIYGIYFGIIIVMILYNLFLFMAVRDVNYLYYICYILFVGLAQASILGYSEVYLWPDNDWLRVNGIILLGGLSGVFTALFVINFLRTKKFAPILNKALWGMLLIDVVAMLLLFMGFDSLSFSIINLVAGIGSAVILVTSVIILKKGFVPARFFVVAYSFFLVSIIIYVLKDYNVLPYNNFTAKSMVFGSAFEIVLLSLALANRINVLIRDKEASQRRALAISKENEKIIMEQNVMLEQKVEERTKELQETNENLTKTLANLREAQSQLIDAEKMASLGQLTAGIAHEINNPINFVTSNVQPLKRDLEDIYEIVDAYAKVTGEKLEEQLAEAHELQKDLDYEYLREEIDSLVQGIAEGAGRTSEIIRGLRTFSRLDEDVVKLASVHENLSSTMVLLRNKIKNEVRVVSEFDAELPQIECYPGKLNQVFMNILNNAIYAVLHKDYPEGEEPTITLKTKKLDDSVRLHFVDNGIGMDEETKHKMYNPFFTTKEVGEGTGLGMSIVYKIIDKHNGTLEVKSELGKGTEFIITLPMTQPSEFE